MIQSNKVSSYVLTTAKIAEHSSHALKDMNTQVNIEALEIFSSLISFTADL